MKNRRRDAEKVAVALGPALERSSYETLALLRSHAPSLAPEPGSSVAQIAIGLVAGLSTAAQRNTRSLTCDVSLGVDHLNSAAYKEWPVWPGLDLCWRCRRLLWRAVRSQLGICACGIH